MAILAGQVLTAARLLNESASTSLTNATPGNDWTDWGTEMLTFSDPGVEVKITAALSGQATRNATPTHEVRVRVAISTDGGATFSVGNNFGNDPNTNVGSGAGAAAQQNVTCHALVQATPTGSVVVKAQAFNETAATGSDVAEGRLTAWIHAV